MVLDGKRANQLDGCPTFATAYLGRKRRADPDFLYSALDTNACAVFFKENRMKCAEATSCTGNRGSPLERFAVNIAQNLPLQPSDPNPHFPFAV